MPTEWIEHLHQAATRVNGKEIGRLLEEVPPEQTQIVVYLRQLVDDFRFEEIVNLVKN